MLWHTSLRSSSNHCRLLGLVSCRRCSAKGGLGACVRRFPVGCVGALVLVCVVLLAIAAPLVSRYDPTHVQLRERKALPLLEPSARDGLRGPRHSHPADVWGTRVVAMSILAVVLGTTIGAFWGVTSAYIGGRYDMLSQRLLEIGMAFPLDPGHGAGGWDGGGPVGGGHCHWCDAPAVWRQGRAGRGPVGERTPLRRCRHGPWGVASQDHPAHITPQCVASYLVLITTQLGVAIVIEASLGFWG